MKSLTVSLKEEQYKNIESLAEEQDASKGKIIRQRLELANKYEELKNERDRLEQQLRATNSRYEEHKKLIKFAEKQKTTVERKQTKQEIKDQANILKKTKWKLFGMPPIEQLENNQK